MTDTPPTQDKGEFWLDRVRSRSGELEDARRALGEACERARREGCSQVELDEAQRLGRHA